MKFIACASILSVGLFKLANAACAGPWAQCGGNNFSGESCCQSGYKCVAINEWYSQCQEGAAEPSTPPQNNAVDNNQWNNNNNNNNNNNQWNNPWENNNNNNNQWNNNNNNNNNQWNNNNNNNNQWNNNNNQVSNNNGSSGSSQNFFLNEIYANPRFIEEIDSSIPKLSGDLAAKAEKVKQVPTAVWLAWDGAPGEVEGHLAAAGSKTVVFILYMIPTRDCNSLASAGGASSLEKYKGYIDDISNTIRSHPESKVVMVVEPDTLGNLVTGSSEACKTVHTLHKNALSYAVNVFGAMSNVSVYLDAAHGKWLGGVTDKVATVVKEILDGAPNGKIRGLSTNVSNYQPVSAEYGYHQKLASSLSAVGVSDMHFIVDTGRNGVDVSSTFSINETWCNFVGTGFGERPQGNPSGMPLLDAYMWLKTPGEADGSSTGSRADPVCARSDSLPGAPDAGQWFHDYFVQLLKNAKPGF
ncbi:1,4-beta-D-glucan-cellobiohydrolase [Piromyces finnis]|uniref:Glucanase n=1 Tax=Piromyces finnis TaxID=1754191 RepID=A0A1Y1V3R8_9FUNG|nr:1,4-beta-D-glucan-cellobiohydrolase [Piromyces finnis]|eukprot:ORX46614.1 1,4-beta-D-glucan-cellobiohydrolase [Piromyces finnis]